MDVVRKEPHHGWIEVIIGSMFSGKSEELIRRLRRAQIARQKVQIFKPLDRHPLRRGPHRVAQRHAHCVARTSATPTSSCELVADDTEVVGIDEGQFFDPNLPAACNTLADRGKRVIVAGLDQDYLGRPFEPMPQLLAIAEYITKTLAICMVCGDPANHTQRLVASSDRVLVGATGLYEARCRHCFDPHSGGGRARTAAESSFRTGSVIAWTSSPARCCLLGVGFLVANAQLGAGLRRGSAAPARGAADVAQPEAAALRASPRPRRRARPPGVRQAGRPAPAGVRRVDDVRLLRLLCCR